VRTIELERIAGELGLDVVGAAPAGPYEETERLIGERRARGLFADMKFTMAQPEVSCHPEQLLPDARTVVSAALCYYAPAPEARAGEGRLPRYTWSDRYAELRESSTPSGAGSVASTGCWSTRTSTSTARLRPGQAWASTARTRC
jgi:epoxyqueuosine reductase QueG